MTLAKDSITRQDWDKDLELYSPFSIRDELIECEIKLRKTVRKLYNEKNITFSDYQSSSNDLQLFLNWISKINSIAFKEILTDMEKPAQAILKATDDLKKVANKIESYQKFFNILSRFIKLGEIIFSAIKAGSVTGSVAAIGSLVLEIQDILDKF